jgi:thioredoxin 1
MIAPIVERLAQRYAGRLKVVKLDVDANQDLAIQYQVMSIPTLLFFKNGQPVDRIIGAVGEQAIIQKIEELLQG